MITQDKELYEKAARELNDKAREAVMLLESKVFKDILKKKTKDAQDEFFRKDFDNESIERRYGRAQSRIELVKEIKSELQDLIYQAEQAQEDLKKFTNL